MDTIFAVVGRTVTRGVDDGAGWANGAERQPQEMMKRNMSMTIKAPLFMQVPYAIQDKTLLDSDTGTVLIRA